MFALARRGTVIAEGLKIVGSVTAEGLVEVNGQIDGELHCTSLIISRKAHVTGAIAAERVVVDGSVEGPIQGGDVVLKSQAHVIGDIQHQSLAIEKGAYFEGRSVQARAANGRQPESLGMRPRQEALKEVANNGRGAVPELDGFANWPLLTEALRLAARAVIGARARHWSDASRFKFPMLQGTHDD